MTRRWLIGGFALWFAHSPNEPFADWYSGLKHPSLGQCCGQADCRVTDFRLAGTGVETHYEVWIDSRFPGESDSGRWVAVPPGNVLQATSNPTGGAVVCWFGGVVRCFVRPADT